jgi:hypothetical protein
MNQCMSLMLPSFENRKMEITFFLTKLTELCIMYIYKMFLIKK